MTALLALYSVRETVEIDSEQNDHGQSIKVGSALGSCRRLLL
jgi:hypothetical protein